MLRSILIAGGACLMFAAASSQAAYVLTFQQQGNDVVATGSGSINLAAVNFQGNIGVSPAVANPAAGVAEAGSAISAGDYAFVTSGTLTFGPGANAISATSGTGDFVGLEDFDGSLFLPVNYVSGASLSSSATFAGTTLAGMGFTPGSYTETLSLGRAPQDTFTVNVVAPEPASLGMLGMSGLALLRRRR
ncbi:MAG TPA: PEP-CTERM sorting domain-containing protein [Tepidisphaeraceae bacterium]|jgi:hypothetical protein